MGKWTILKSDNSEHTSAILDFLLEKYCEIFGFDVMHGEDCIIYNDTEADCPYFFHTEPPKIRLSQKSLIYWSQTVYQLSHEMCHYAMYEARENKRFVLSWFEEIVCEATSLYALEYAANEWARCRLSEINPTFDREHRSYLIAFFDEVATDELKSCKTPELLREHERQKITELRREGHARERNLVYRAISQNPGALKAVLDYQKYLNPDGITINFDRWLRDNPSRLIKAISLTQPVR